ncbi:ferritin-like domain-containing protein, partial [Burkholderia pseudomallei]
PIAYAGGAAGSGDARERPAGVNALVRRNLSAEMCVKMLLKPLGLSAKFQQGLHYPLKKLTQHVFFR